MKKLKIDSKLKDNVKKYVADYRKRESCNGAEYFIRHREKGKKLDSVDSLNEYDFYKKLESHCEQVKSYTYEIRFYSIVTYSDVKAAQPFRLEASMAGVNITSRVSPKTKKLLGLTVGDL